MRVDKDEWLRLVFIFQYGSHQALACSYIPYQRVKYRLVLS